MKTKKLISDMKDHEIIQSATRRLLDAIKNVHDITPNEMKTTLWGVKMLLDRVAHDARKRDGI